MIGDAFARGKRKSTTAPGPEFKEKNSKGKSYKHVPGRRASDGGAAHELKRSAMDMRKHGTKGQRGPGSKDAQSPRKQRERKEVEHLEPGDVSEMRKPAGRKLTRNSVESWCGGKREKYC